MNTQILDEIGQRLTRATFSSLIRLYPAIRSATPSQQDAACKAMRDKLEVVIKDLVGDIEAAPHCCDQAVASAVMTLVQEGIRSLQAAQAGAGAAGDPAPAAGDPAFESGAVGSGCGG